MLVKKTGQKLKSLTMIWFEWKKVLSSLEPNVNDFIQGISLNTERSYKRQGHATLKHFVGFFVQWWKAEITVA